MGVYSIYYPLDFYRTLLDSTKPSPHAAHSTKKFDLTAQTSKTLLIWVYNTLSPPQLPTSYPPSHSNNCKNVRRKTHLHERCLPPYVPPNITLASPIYRKNPLTDQCLIKLPDPTYARTSPPPPPHPPTTKTPQCSLHHSPSTHTK